MAVYYFSGIENYLKKQELKKRISDIEAPDLNVVHFYENENGLYDFIFSYPFIGDKKIGVLHYFPESEEFLSSIKELPDYCDLYIITDQHADRRKKTVKEIIQHVEETEFKKIDDNLLYKCISSRLQRLGYAAEEIESVKDILMECFQGYNRHYDIDLEVVQKHVQMIAFSGTLNEETIRAFAPDSSDYRAFILSNKLLAKDNGCIAFANSLLEQGENAIGILSLVAYQIRVCYKAVLFSDENYLALINIRRYQLYENYKDYSAKKYVSIYRILMESIRRIKKGEDASAVVTDCLTDSLAVLKEEHNYG